MRMMAAADALAIAVTQAIRSGDVQALRHMLSDHPNLATARIQEVSACSGRSVSRSLLHLATDWPGHFPNVADTVATLVAAGADVDATFDGTHGETPLHWAASSDDLEALDALLNHGANIEAPGAVIGGGTPLADAAAFGQWNAARRLVQRGAQTTLWQAAALGLIGRVQGHFAGAPLQPWHLDNPDGSAAAPDEVTHAFWCACHGGQQSTAEFLLARGANINWIGYDRLTPLGAARRTGADKLVAWLAARGGKTTEQV